MTKSYHVYLSNFPAVTQSTRTMGRAYATLDEALTAAAKDGFEAIVQCHIGLQRATVASWSPIGGRHFYGNVAWGA